MHVFNQVRSMQPATERHRQWRWRAPHAHAKHFLVSPQFLNTCRPHRQLSIPQKVMRLLAGRTLVYAAHRFANTFSYIFTFRDWLTSGIFPLTGKPGVLGGNWGSSKGKKEGERRVTWPITCWVFNHVLFQVLWQLVLATIKWNSTVKVFVPDVLFCAHLWLFLLIILSTL